MSDFLYFIEGGLHLLGVEEAKLAGLGYVFDTPRSGAGHQSGPCGSGEGQIYSNGSDMQEQRLDEENQVWRKIPKTDGRLIKKEGEPPSPVWVGYWKDRPPKPEDLVRDKVFPGHSPVLGDGNAWLCPVARDRSGGCQFPYSTDLDDDGNFIPGNLSGVHEKLFQLAVDYYQAVYQSVNDVSNYVKLDSFSGLRECALFALSVNYRVGPTEAVLLNIFSSEEDAFNIFRSLIDLPTFDKEWLYEYTKDEKKKIEGSSLVDGKQAALPTTSQVSQT